MSILESVPGGVTSGSRLDPSIASDAKAGAFLADLQMLALRLKHVPGSGEGGEALSPAARAVLELVVRSGPQSVPQIARARDTSRQNIQIIVNRLEQAGYLESGPNPAHRRADVLSITAKGKGLLQRTQSPQEQVVEHFERQVSGPDLAAGLRLLKELRDLLNELRSPGENVAPGDQRGSGSSQASAPGVSQPASGSGEESEELPVSLL